MPRFVEDAFGRWGTFIAERQRYVLGAAPFLALLSVGPAIWTLQHLDVNVFNQVDESLKRVRYLREFNEAFGGDFLAAVITISKEEAKQPGRVAELKTFGEILAKELEKVGLSSEDHELWHEKKDPHPWLFQVEVRVGKGLEHTRETLRKTYLHAGLNLEDVAKIETRFTSEALRARMEEFVPEYRDAPSDSERLKLRSDPLNLEELEEDSTHSHGLAPGPDGYFLSQDGTTLLVMGRPIGIAQDLLFSNALLTACQRAENRAIKGFRVRSPTPHLTTALKGEEFAKLAAGEAPPQIRVGFTGLHAIAFESELSMRWDILATTGSSIVAVLVLFMVVFRRIRLALFIGLTMILSVLLTLSITWFLQGKIGVMGASFPCILLGMGVDYGIHLYSTFHNFRENRQRVARDVLALTMRKCGPGILAASMTTMVAFFGISRTHFKGLAELGLLAGIGLFASAVMMLSFFPALLLIGWDRGTGTVSSALRRPTQILGRFHQKRRRNRLGLLIGVALLMLCMGLVAWGPEPKPDALMGVAFDSEFTNLRSLRVKAFPLRERIAERFGQGFTDTKVMVVAPDEAGAFAGVDQAVRNAEPFINEKELQPSGGILDIIPSPETQHKTLESLRKLDIPACRRRFLSAAREKFGDRAENAFQPFLEKLDDFHQSVTDGKIMTVKSILEGELASLLGLFARIDGEGGNRQVKLALNYFPGELLYPESWYYDMVGRLERNAPEGAEIRVSAPRMVGFELKKSLFADMQWISGLVFLSVSTLLMFTFRSPRRALLAAMPLIFGFLFVLAGVAFAQRLNWNLSLNYVNLMIFPILLGSGIDYGVYLVFDAYSHRRPRLVDVVSETGRGVLMCGLTTLAGFGSMVGGSFTGLISFGWTAILGYTGALFGALIVLPSLMGLMGMGQEEDPPSTAA